MPKAQPTGETGGGALPFKKVAKPWGLGPRAEEPQPTLPHHYVPAGKPDLTGREGA